MGMNSLIGRENVYTPQTNVQSSLDYSNYSQIQMKKKGATTLLFRGPKAHLRFSKMNNLNLEQYLDRSSAKHKTL